MNARTSASGRVLSTWLRFDPAAAGGANPDPHLAVEERGAMAVAVDRQRHAGRDRGARVLPVEVDVRGRAVHFEGRSGLGGRRVDGIEIQRISRRAVRRAVGRVREDRDERMPDRLQARRVSAVHRGPRNRAARPGRYRAARAGRRGNRAAVRHDVGFDAVKDGHLRDSAAQSRQSRPAGAPGRGASSSLRPRRAPNDR